MPSQHNLSKPCCSQVELYIRWWSTMLVAILAPSNMLKSSNTKHPKCKSKWHSGSNLGLGLVGARVWVYLERAIHLQQDAPGLMPIGCLVRKLWPAHHDKPTRIECIQHLGGMFQPCASYFYGKPHLDPQITGHEGSRAALGHSNPAGPGSAREG